VLNEFFKNRKLTRRWWKNLLGIGLAAVMLLAAGGSFVFAQKKYELSFNTLFHGGDAQAMVRIVEKFNKENPQVKIDLVQGQWEDYYAKLYTTVAAGEPPHIGITHTTYIPSMAPAMTPLEKSRAGNLLDIAGIKGEDYVEDLWKAGVYEGTRYVVPLDTHMWALWYNKDLFKEAGLDPNNPPNTGKELEEAASKIKAIGKYVIHPADIGKPRHFRRAWYILFWQQGGELFDKDFAKATFNNDKGLRALEYLVNVFQKWGWNKPGTNGNAQFVAGRLGMLWVGNWFYWTAERSGVNYATAPMPQIFDKRVTWGNSHNMIIPKQPLKVSDNVIVTAIKTIKWISENSDIWGIYGGHAPAYKPVLEGKKLGESKTWKKSLSVLSDMALEGALHYPIIHPQAKQLEHSIQVYVEEAVNGIISPQEALDKAEEEVNEILGS